MLMVFEMSLLFVIALSLHYSIHLIMRWYAKFKKARITIGSGFIIIHAIISVISVILLGVISVLAQEYV